MANVRTARLIERDTFRESALMRFELSDGEPLAFRGGQYVIVDTGLVLPDGKRRKRAYSLCSPDRDPRRFELGVHAVEGGLGAAYMLALEPGAELHFSGPWGKLVPPTLTPTPTLTPAAASIDGPVWVIATDTGITAALGLVHGAGFAPALPHTTLCWWTASADYFLSRAAIAARLPPGLGLREARLPMIGSPERSLALPALLDELASDGLPACVYVTGDGLAPACVRAWCEQRGLTSIAVQGESLRSR